MDIKKVCKDGGSAIIRLDKKLMAANTGISIGDNVVIEYKRSQIVIKKTEDLK